MIELIDSAENFREVADLVLKRFCDMKRASLVLMWHKCLLHLFEYVTFKEL